MLDNTRQRVYDRDKGICAQCGIDTSNTQYQQTVKPTVSRIRTTFWDADHIQERRHGGRNHLDNLQTLCIPCHRKKTGMTKRLNTIEPSPLTLRLSKNLHKGVVKYAGKHELSAADYIRQAILEKIARESKEKK